MELKFHESYLTKKNIAKPFCWSIFFLSCLYLTFLLRTHPCTVGASGCLNFSFLLHESQTEVKTFAAPTEPLAIFHAIYFQLGLSDPDFSTPHLRFCISK